MAIKMDGKALAEKMRAQIREEVANQRWYREEVRPLSLPGRRIFLFCSAKFILNRRDYYADL